LPTPTSSCDGACQFCYGGVPVRVPTGINLLDRGLNSTTTWMDFKTLVAFTNPEDGKTSKTTVQVPQPALSGNQASMNQSPGTQA
jgi:hypothetical protein